MYHYGDKYEKKITFFEEFELSASNFNENKNKTGKGIQKVERNKYKRDLYMTKDFFSDLNSQNNCLFDETIFPLMNGIKSIHNLHSLDLNYE